MPINAAAKWFPSLHGLVVLLHFNPFGRQVSQKGENSVKPLTDAPATYLKRILLVAVSHASCKKIRGKLHETFTGCSSTLRRARSFCLRALDSQTAGVRSSFGERLDSSLSRLQPYSYQLGT